MYLLVPERSTLEFIGLLTSKSTDLFVNSSASTLDSKTLVYIRLFNK